MKRILIKAKGFVMESMPVIFALCGDVGGANAIAPVIERLRNEQRVRVAAYAYGVGLMAWRQAGVDVITASEDWTVNEVGAELSRLNAALAFVATSVNGIDLEKKVVTAARQQGIASLAVLDFWSNYKERFSDGSGSLTCLPDQIAVMDELACEEMIKAGIDKARIVVTGQPGLDSLAEWQSRFSTDKRESIRQHLGIDQKETLILFASQPLSELCGSDRSSLRYPGYTEKTVLEALLRAIEKLVLKGRRPVLVIRPHPREKRNGLSDIRSDVVRIVISSYGQARDVVLSADVVTGMDSMLLVESCYMGCPTVSIQPGLLLPDSLPTNHNGMTKAVYHESDILPVLEGILGNIDQMTKSSRSSVAGCDATSRVLALIYSKLSEQSCDLSEEGVIHG